MVPAQEDLHNLSPASFAESYVICYVVSNTYIPWYLHEIPKIKHTIYRFAVYFLCYNNLDITTICSGLIKDYG